MRSRLLVVDDKRDLARGVALILEEDVPASIAVAHSAEEALSHLQEHTVDLVLSDIKMPGMDGVALLERIKERWPRTQVILFTGFGTIESAVEAIKRGAYHYLTKPFNNDELLVLVRRALQEQRDRDELTRLRAELDDKQNFHGLYGRDPAMLRVFDTIRKISPSHAAVLVWGDSGTGKELVARALHEQSPRRLAPFVAFNAAAVPDTLAEAELFGARKGAYTGADRDRLGLFSEADGGTLFIDEVGSMSLPLQGKLLRVLQDGEVMPLGAGRTVKVNVRVVSALNVDPMRLVTSGALRRDLYYRLSVVRLNLPPLCDRVLDIPLLASLFLEQKARELSLPPKVLSPRAVRLLVGYDWPGNVRELQNVMERALLMTHGEEIGPGDILLEDETASLPMGDGPAPPYEEAKAQALEQFQRRYVERLLAESKGNIAAGARQAGITRAALHRILRRLGIASGGEAEQV